MLIKLQKNEAWWFVTIQILIIKWIALIQNLKKSKGKYFPAFSPLGNTVWLIGS